MSKPKIIHSFWTRPLENNMYGIDKLSHLIGDIWIYSLSVEYALREGFEIELHTDSLGAILFAHIPYTRIYKTLDNIPKSISPRFWAAGKVWAIEAAGDNSIHIDGDVFIKDKTLLECSKDTDFIVLSLEHVSYESEINKISPTFKQFCTLLGIKPEETYSYNTGVIGIFNRELRNTYITKYKELVSKCSQIFKTELLENPWVTPDLLCEQRLFTCLSEGYKRSMVIPDESVTCPKGYQHLITGLKYSSEIQNKVKETLRLLFPISYKNNLQLCQNI